MQSYLSYKNKSKNNIFLNQEIFSFRELKEKRIIGKHDLLNCVNFELNALLSENNLRKVINKLFAFEENLSVILSNEDNKDDFDNFNLSRIYNNLSPILLRLIRENIDGHMTSNKNVLEALRIVIEQELYYLSEHYK